MNCLYYKKKHLAKKYTFYESSGKGGGGYPIDSPLRVNSVLYFSHVFANQTRCIYVSARSPNKYSVNGEEKQENRGKQSLSLKRLKELS